MNVKKLKSEMDEWDCHVATTFAVPEAIEGGYIKDRICNSVKESRHGDIFSNKEELQLNIRMLAVGR